MPRVRLFHWKAAEAAGLIATLKAAGYSVEYEEALTRDTLREAREWPPDAFVVDLTLRPSHGREVAVALRGSRKSRHVPIVFVDGEPKKVEGVRRVIPDAVYTSRARLAAAIGRANPLVNPFVPTQMMDRYAGRTTAQKMGICKEARVAVVDPPAGYAKAIGALPEGAVFEEGDCEDCKVTIWFVHDFAGFQGALPSMRRVAARSKLWILWRKGKQDGLDGNVIRQGGIDVGLVDYKICSVNQTWSGMVFAVRKG